MSNPLELINHNYVYIYYMYALNIDFCMVGLHAVVGGAGEGQVEEVGSGKSYICRGLSIHDRVKIFPWCIP